MKLTIGRPTQLPILAHGTPDQGFATMRVTSPFGWRGSEFHGGLDIGNAREGDAVTAAAAGRVLAAGYLGAPWSEPTTRYPSGNYGGLMVVLEHAPRVATIYAHLATRNVAAGFRVAAGQVVGSVGSTGSARDGGAHLHFGLQAPAAAVPAGVGTRATRYGFGLDVDPWPLIAGPIALTLVDQEDPMPTFGGAQLRHVTDHLTTKAGARFRAAPELEAPILATLPAGTAILAHAVVKGEPAAGSDEWAVAWLYVDGRWRLGYLHVSTLTDAPEPDTAAALKAKVREGVAIITQALD